MKVLMIGNDPSVKGGISSVISQLLEYDWISYGIEMQFLPTYVDRSPIVKVLFFIKSLYRFVVIISKNCPDIVHIHMSYKGSFIRKNILFTICKKKGIPVIIHLHGSEFEKWYINSTDSKKKKIRKMILGADGFIVLGEKWEQVIKGIEPEARTYILMNSTKIRDDIVCWNIPFKLLFLGVLIPRKGVNDLIEALNILKTDSFFDNIRLIIAGSGQEEKKLIDKCKKYSLESKVEFLGWIDGEKKEETLASCQVLILPSYNEGLPIAILDAIGYGMPIIATDVGDVCSAVCNEVNGFLIKPGDIKGLACAIRKVFDKDRFDKMKEESLNLAKREFSEDNYFSRVIRIYQNVSNSYFQNRKWKNR